MQSILRLLQRILLQLIKRLQRFEKSWFGERPSLNQTHQVIRSTNYDMAQEPDEAYYRDEYLYWVLQPLTDAATKKPRSWLDLGCGQGRLTIPLAHRYPEDKFYGVDISATAIAAAVSYADSHTITNCHFQTSDILQWLAASSDFADIVIMNEVTFFFPEWEKALRLIEQRTRPGAYVFISFRPLYYYALSLIRAGLVQDASSELLQSNRGPLFPGSPVELTWYDSKTVIDLLESNFKFSIVSTIGIGCCSGIAGDPHSEFTRPSALNQSDIQALRDVERHLAPLVPDAGRYMLFTLRRI